MPDGAVVLPPEIQRKITDFVLGARCEHCGSRLPKPAGSLTLHRSPEGVIQAWELRETGKVSHNADRWLPTVYTDAKVERK